MKDTLGANENSKERVYHANFNKKNNQQLRKTRESHGTREEEHLLY